jgi:putative transcriptional regulator
MMKAGYFARINEVKKIEAGSVLIAQPFWKEEMYQRAVLLILEHNSQGTTGILLNRMSNLLVTEAIPSLELMKPLYYGGAFQTKIISYLHSNGNVPDSVYLGNEIFWGGNFDSISEMVGYKKIDLRQINFFAGFTNWAPGQLEDEIINSKWWISETCASDLFSVSTDELWAQSLEQCGNIYAMFKNIPDPSIS